MMVSLINKFSAIALTLLVISITTQNSTSFIARSINVGFISETKCRRFVTYMAGFGANSSGSSKKQKKTIQKLKPKQQWDRYLSLKDCKTVTAAVRKDGKDENEWINVGYVKSASNEFTDIAIARQRALIAEHAKRLFPLKISAKDNLQWGYLNSDEDEYIPVSKDVCDDAPDDIEKKIGFEGIADPQTGFYCNYKDGRIVNLNDSSDKNFLSKTPAK